MVYPDERILQPLKIMFAKSLCRECLWGTKIRIPTGDVIVYDSNNIPNVHHILKKPVKKHIKNNAPKY